MVRLWHQREAFHFHYCLCHSCEEQHVVFFSNYFFLLFPVPYFCPPLFRIPPTVIVGNTFHLIIMCVYVSSGLADCDHHSFSLCNECIYIYMILYVVVSYLIALQSRINYLEIGPSDSLLLFKKNQNKTLCARMNLANEKLL